MTEDILLGYEVGSGAPVKIPALHIAITGQTQQSGKTTTLEALASRSSSTVLTFITKRGEASFQNGCRITPYFRDRADWQFVTSILDATLQEKNKFLRPWIMKICRSTKSLREVQEAVRLALTTAKGINEGVYTQLDAYLELIVPEIERANLSDELFMAENAVNVMDVSSFATPMQMLFVQSALDWINDFQNSTTVVIPEAWEFVPEGKGSPVKQSAITLVRKGAAIGNHIWVDSQDMAGVDKTILRGCTVWLIGVQREANEIKRNLSNIPASIKRPSAADVANLERGQFFACWGRHCVKTYVQPAWMTSVDANLVAVGKSSVDKLSGPKPEAPHYNWTAEQTSRDFKIVSARQEPTVTPAKAKALRDENAELKKQIEGLKQDLTMLRIRYDGAPMLDNSNSQPMKTPAGVGLAHTMEEIFDPEWINKLYAEIKRMAAIDPTMIRLLMQKPEIEVKVERTVITIDGTSLKGRVAMLIHRGFLDIGKRHGEIRSELKRTGPDVNSGNLATALADLQRNGFLTKEAGETYQAVKGMKVNVKQAA